MHFMLDEKRVIIVADGPSARGFIPPVKIPVIAVNGAIEWLPRADFWFTLDPSADNIRRMSNQKPGTRYYAAVAASTALPEGVKRLNRYSYVPDKTKEPTHGTPSWWFWRYGCVPGLSYSWPFIHTGNSAYGAVGLAFLMGAKKILLVGVDASDEGRMSGGHSKTLCHLPMLFASALPQVNMVSVGGLNSVPQMDMKKGLDWLCAPL